MELVPKNSVSGESNKLSALSAIEIRNRQRDLVEGLASGELTTIDDICDKYGIDYVSAQALIEDPQIQTFLINNTRTKANLLFHRKAVDAIGRIIDGGEDKDIIQALKLLGEMSRNLKGGTGTSVQVGSMNVTLENRIKDSDSRDEIKSLENLIDQSKVIDIDLENETQD